MCDFLYLVKLLKCDGEEVRHLDAVEGVGIGREAHVRLWRVAVHLQEGEATIE